MNCNPVLVQSYRGKTLESFHRGVYCVVNEQGEIVKSAGDPYQLTSPRSALKFFQQIPLVESGAAAHYEFTPRELAVMCGSHNGEESHVQVVRGILSKTGLAEDALQCGPQMPGLHQDRVEFYKNGLEAKPVFNNCSGKHAGFLALSQYWNAGIKDYLAPQHPVQQAVKQTVAAMHELPEEALEPGIDGCSAPIFAMPVLNMAIGYKNLVKQSSGAIHKDACQKLVNAVREHPYMIAGKKRYDTDLIENLGAEVIGKTGAEGVFSLGFPGKGWGAAIKIDDGKMGPQYRVAQKLINHLMPEKGGEHSQFARYLEEPLKNLAGWEIGKSKVNEQAF